MSDLRTMDFFLTTSHSSRRPCVVRQVVATSSTFFMTNPNLVVALKYVNPALKNAEELSLSFHGSYNLALKETSID